MTTPSNDAGFAMDVAGARRAVDQYTDALRQLRAIRNDANALGRIEGAVDRVSHDAAQALVNAGVGEKGGLIQALDSGIQHLSDTINTLQAAIGAYESGDTQAGSDLGSTT